MLFTCLFICLLSFILFRFGHSPIFHLDIVVKSVNLMLKPMLLYLFTYCYYLFLLYFIHLLILHLHIVVKSINIMLKIKIIILIPTFIPYLLSIIYYLTSFYSFIYSSFAYRSEKCQCNVKIKIIILTATHISYFDLFQAVTPTFLS